MPQQLGHIWSLSVEMHFYFVWPFVLMALIRLRRPSLAFMLAWLYVMATLWRAAAVLAFGWHHTYYGFDTRVSGLILGSWLASVMNRPYGAQQLARMAPAVWPAVLLMVVTMAFARWDGGWPLAWGVVAIEWCTVALLIACCQSRHLLKAVLSMPGLAWLGRLSYGLYLWHYPLFKYLRDDGHWLWALGAGGVLSLLLAALSYYFIERRWLRR